MTAEFPSPTVAAATREQVLIGYLDYFRARIIDKIAGLSAGEQRASRLASGWTPLELARHLRWVELRWLQWGFRGEPVADPWGDEQAGRWHVEPDATAEHVLAELTAQGDRTRAIVASADLDDVGAPGERWDGAPPPTLERILLHLLQEYARHLGHLDVVSELAGGDTGE
ncbi:DUF664 domain-containing protein [uncultured Jatrophihabitans sp.]|uniref:mycothiol transferase n=1 Tax=uncultured Jatrophihabitans sp. TaxID=1610747 RepID=UPI0035CBA3F5